MATTIRQIVIERFAAKEDISAELVVHVLQQELATERMSQETAIQERRDLARRTHEISFVDRVFAMYKNVVELVFTLTTKLRASEEFMFRRSVDPCPSPAEPCEQTDLQHRY